MLLDLVLSLLIIESATVKAPSQYLYIPLYSYVNKSLLGSSKFLPIFKLVSSVDFPVLYTNEHEILFECGKYWTIYVITSVWTLSKMFSLIFPNHEHDINDSHQYLISFKNHFKYCEIINNFKHNRILQNLSLNG